MNDVPLFSIVMATFNPGAKLEATLDSVRSQEASWELIVCDGGSRDGTRELLENAAQADARLR